MSPGDSPDVETLSGGFQVFLAARDPSSAATALHAMRQLWKVLEELPLYNKLLAGDHRMAALIPLSAQTPGYFG